MGSIGIGKDRLSAVDFSGTMLVDTYSDNDFIGFVFSYQDSSNFYVVYSARSTNGHGGPWRIVRVASTTGPSLYLGDLYQGGLNHIKLKLGSVAGPVIRANGRLTFRMT